MDNERSDGLRARRVELHPDIVEGADLPGLDEIQVFVVEVQPLWVRCVEQLTLHLVGSGVTAVIAFTLGMRHVA